ncbi:MAG TPA: AMP-dependent synthetase [Flavobacteriales bacterium]|jgi:long-chain acyl-CoA synthetase|nr:AMP-dependent synthetase [Flavobacteriales bacterium]
MDDKILTLPEGRRNIIELLNLAASEYGDLRYASRKSDQGWESFTYREICDRSKYLSSSMLNMGLSKGQNAAILSEGSPQWIWSEYSLLNNGMRSVPLSVKLQPEELPYRLNHSQCAAIFTSKNNLAKVAGIFEKLDNSKTKIFYLDQDEAHFRATLDEYNIPQTLGSVVESMIDDGKMSYHENPEKVDILIREIDENDVVNISYTSGTTGNPKGIMLTHLNYYSNAFDGVSMFRIRHKFRTLVILPVDHSFAHTVALYGALFKALDLFFLDTRGGTSNALKNIPINLKEVNPQFLLTVPALTGNFIKKMKEGVKEKGRVIEQLFNCGLNAGIRANGDGFTKPGFGFRILDLFRYNLSKYLIFNKLKSVFGNEIEYMVGGGAMLDIKQQQFYYAIGAPVFQGYGLTEATPIISANTPFDHKMGSSGKLLAGVTCRIMKNETEEATTGERGEIVIKGNNVMKGYYKNDEETAKTIRDNWLWTGDLGYIDEDGFLFVTGRDKALLISEDGEKYSPEGIENAIENSASLIGQAMVYNDHKKYSVAVITLDPMKISLLPNDPSEALEAVRKDFFAYQKDAAYSGQFQTKWLPKYFFIAPEPFTEENQQVNSTMKMVRYKITEHYTEEIELLYGGSAKEQEKINLSSIRKALNPTSVKVNV